MKRYEWLWLILCAPVLAQDITTDAHGRDARPERPGERYMVYDLPFGKGQRWISRGGVANALLGGWNFSIMSSLNSELAQG